MNPDISNHDCAERVLEAAMQVFCESGYRASIDLVATRAGVARQTVYNRFGSKQTLFESALSAKVEEMLAIFENGKGNLRDRLIEFGVSFRARALTPESVNLHRVLTSEASRFPELGRHFYQNCVQRCTTQIAAELTRSMQAGDLRQEDGERTANMLLDLLASREKLAMIFGEEPPALDREQETVTNTIDFFLRALKPL
ncbi:AcrR family transcriptional regulator [Silvimonas terrae]|uniref:AcrR family transcriptional regulator n=1 Tax=Silvimonas terrae TaxID=300266 RepID=A0A840RE08_9NEIS|nr:TetR/AcrR family transcriptional regulator [Silvimonas terrae]MBB5190593.1 AcrR family transcriptional regulator [Silvimonas terrae]